MKKAFCLGILATLSISGCQLSNNQNFPGSLDASPSNKTKNNSTLDSDQLQKSKSFFPITTQDLNKTDISSSSGIINMTNNNLPDGTIQIHSDFIFWLQYKNIGQYNYQRIIHYKKLSDNSAKKDLNIPLNEAPLLQNILASNNQYVIWAETGPSTQGGSEFKYYYQSLASSVSDRKELDFLGEYNSFLLNNNNQLLLSKDLVDFEAMDLINGKTSPLKFTAPISKNTYTPVYFDTNKIIFLESNNGLLERLIEYDLQKNSNEIINTPLGLPFGDQRSVISNYINDEFAFTDVVDGKSIIGIYNSNTNTRDDLNIAIYADASNSLTNADNTRGYIATLSLSPDYLVWTTVFAKDENDNGLFVFDRQKKTVSKVTDQKQIYLSSEGVSSYGFAEIPLLISGKNLFFSGYQGQLKEDFTNVEIFTIQLP